MKIDDRVLRSLGFVAMFGGALYGVMWLAFPVLLGGGSTTVGGGVLFAMVVLGSKFMLPGSVGLYLAQRDAFGRLSTVAAAVFAGTFCSTSSSSGWCTWG